MLSISALWWLILLISVDNDMGDTVLTGVFTTVVPVGIGIYGIIRGWKPRAVKELVSKEALVARETETVIRQKEESITTRNLLIKARRAFGYALSVLSIMFLVVGLFVVMMPFVDPEVWTTSGDRLTMFATGGSFSLIGLLEALGLRGFYKRHQTFFKVAFSAGSLIVILIGIVCILVTATTAYPKSMPYLVASFVFGSICLIAGLYYLIIRVVTLEKLRRSRGTQREGSVQTIIYIVSFMLGYQLLAPYMGWVWWQAFLGVGVLLGLANSSLQRSAWPTPLHGRGSHHI